MRGSPGVRLERRQAALLLAVASTSYGPPDIYRNVHLQHITPISDEGRKEVLEKVLAGLPWYAQKLYPEIPTARWLKDLCQWDGPAVHGALRRQVLAKQKVTRAINDITEAVRSLANKEAAYISAEAVEELGRILWTEVGKQLGDKATRLRLPGVREWPEIQSRIEQNLAEASRANWTRIEDDGGRRGRDADELDAEEEEEVVEFINALVDEGDNIARRQDQGLLSQYNELLQQTDSTVSQAMQQYGAVARKLITFQHNPGPSLSFRAPTFGATSFGGSSFGGAGRLIPAPTAALVGAVNDHFPMHIQQQITNVNNPFSSLSPDAMTMWEQQMRLMELLGRPGSPGDARNRLNEVGRVMRNIERESAKLLQFLNDGRHFVIAIRKALENKSLWNAQRADVRWARACLISSLNEYMTSNVVDGHNMRHAFGSRALQGTGSLDFEYLRMIQTAKLIAPNQYRSTVQSWLAKPDLTKYIVEVADDISTAPTAVSAAVLKRAGFEHFVVKGDLAHRVEPIVMTERDIQDCEVARNHIRDRVKPHAAADTTVSRTTIKSILRK
ncbi:hypothetical protein GNI_078540 [Gregarina niphandrodes]|uniref:Uncharacterized protein n=1 Tax=Gregarina niphandrodes TaxID=110365 RepID=A0A023B6L7_GRENI|nr:hypothetical protein GNI_078540 [Gregarina niphandrodes]EZG66606.1 hypothetical protein GNI_078540 [Gregarina niphandrodes]|eukprot:XP_011130571.1 hypothetical protein GNI_078540 [Gregarina niphandrodes]